MPQSTPQIKLLCCLIGVFLSFTHLFAQSSSESAARDTISKPAQTEPAQAALSTRVEDLEAYIRNEAPKGSLSGEPGPGHNAWMMISTALVLFMTLPGLALFYGGLVRKKTC